MVNISKQDIGDLKNFWSCFDILLENIGHFES